MKPYLKSLDYANLKRDLDHCRCGDAAAERRNNRAQKKARRMHDKREMLDELKNIDIEGKEGEPK